jgi:hypothetical protein
VSLRVPPLQDLDSILWLEDRSPLGRIDDVFGPVAQPLYSVRCADAAAAAVFRPRIGQKVPRVLSLHFFPIIVYSDVCHLASRLKSFPFFVLC